MKKVIDWNAAEERARKMDDSALGFARKDARECADLWDRAGIENDPDGNAGYYRDEASIYAREQKRRGLDMRQLPEPCTLAESSEFWRRRDAAREGRTYHK
jgi:hypothetical protein